MRGFELVKREDHWALYNEDGHKIAATLDGCNSKLSVKNCEAIANGYDLDELVRESCNITDPLRLDSQKYKQDPYFKIGFNKGFQKALEILGDKKFSETELYRAFLINSAGNNTTLENTFKEIVLPMFQETEWDVEIVTKPMNLDEIREQGKGFLNSNTNKPKLDKNGCLILKKK
jgi:hypothetical protein